MKREEDGREQTEDIPRETALLQEEDTILNMKIVKSA